MNLLRKFDLNALVLDVGGGDRALDLPGYVNLDVDRSTKPVVLGDAHHLPFVENTFDVIISQSVIEHVRKPWVVADEIYRVSKKGGYVYVESGFMQPLHDCPGHFFNTTKEGLRLLFDNFHEISSGVQPHQMPSQAILWFLIEVIYGAFPNLALFSKSSSESYVAKSNKHIRALLASIFSAYDRLVDKRRAEFIAAGVYYLGEKQ